MVRIFGVEIFVINCYLIFDKHRWVGRVQVWGAHVIECYLKAIDGPDQNAMENYQVQTINYGVRGICSANAIPPFRRNGFRMECHLNGTDFCSLWTIQRGFERITPPRQTLKGVVVFFSLPVFFLFNTCFGSINRRAHFMRRRAHIRKQTYLNDDTRHSYFIRNWFCIPQSHGVSLNRSSFLSVSMQLFLFSNWKATQLFFS